MMLSEPLKAALDDQLNKEIYSGYLYLAMAAWFEERGLKGFAQWMKVQALEELYHAMKFFNFIAERGAKPELAEVENPPADWKSPADVFQAVAEHEAKVTGRIHNLVDLARKEKDHATENFLQWFVSEQVEEESSAGEILDQLKLAGDQAGALFMLDREVGQRAFTLPPDLKIPIIAGKAP